ncbi:hypothetical protein ACERZ8_00200 [Tateyamaria armeniaca]|uniref:AMIN domain-containing protein n=1 Tax=Tateyamaria armeniaca TaxID=2518930 RepID=A0ABW8UQK9_9RHOB
MASRVFFGFGLFLIISLATGASSVTATTEERSKMKLELHFTEGFSGQQISIHVNGRTVAEFSALTRFQTGLAHIEVLDLPDGEEVVIDFSDPKTSVHLDVDASHPFVTFALEHGVLTTHKTNTRPGYL